MEKVLLLHGPIPSMGINAVTQRIHTGTEARKQQDIKFVFNSEPNIIALSYAFRALGYKICYSGWKEDQAWLEKNSDLFDGIVISDQSPLKTESRSGSLVLPNVKEKLYFSSLQGLREVERLYGSDALVFRLRSDVSVRPDLANAEMERLRYAPTSVWVEYFRNDNLFYFPDFLMATGAGVMRAIYESLYNRSVAGNDYHVSSHIEHCLTCIVLQQEGIVGGLNSMSKELFDTLVWRGIPRYLETSIYGENPSLMFGVSLSIGKDFDVQALVDVIHPNLSGRSVA